MQHIKSLIAALALSLAACKTDTSATGAPAKEAMGLYAKGFNLVLKDPHGMVDDYFRSVPESGPVEGPLMPHLFGTTLTASSVKEAREAFEAAKSAAPPTLSALGPEADRVMTAVDKLTLVYNDAKKYYDAETFKDDHLAKGKALHADMIAASKELDTALGALGDGLSGVEDAQAAEDVAAHASEHDYSYWFRAYTLAAKKLLTAVQHAHTPADVKALGPAFDALDATHADFAKFVASKGTDLPTWFGGYAGMADSYAAAATKLRRAIAAGGEGADAAEGSLVSAYNSCVNTGNSLYDIEASGAMK